MIKTEFFQGLTFLCFILLFGFSTNSTSATLFENFDSPSIAAPNNNGYTIVYSSGSWLTYGITKPTLATENDRINGVYSMRMRGYDGKNTIEMKFDKVGAGVVSFNYGSYSNHSGGEFTLQKSINQGASWQNVGTPITVPTWNGSFFTCFFPVNQDGNVRFKIVMTCLTPNNANQQVNIDDFQITDFGSEQTIIPSITPATGVYETPQNASIISATTGANIYYTTDGSTPTTTSTLYTAPFSVTKTTTIKSLAVLDGKENSRVETSVINIPVLVDNLAAFYNFIPASGTGLQYYKFTGDAVVTFVYWSSSTNTAKSILVQDNTAGILINDNFKKLTTTYNIGDKITGIIAQVNAVNSSPQLYPYADFAVSSTNNTLSPKAITLADVPSKINQLVQINDLYFDAANGTTKFGVNTSQTVHDASTPVTTSIVYNTPSLIAVTPDYVSTTVIPTKMNMVCLVMKNNPNNTYYYLFPRSLADLNVPFRELTGLSTPSVSGISIANKKVNFETLTVENVNVYAVSGQIVRSMKSQIGQNSILLPTGIYMLKIGNGVTKICIQ